MMSLGSLYRVLPTPLGRGSILSTKTTLQYVDGKLIGQSAVAPFGRGGHQPTSVSTAATLGKLDNVEARGG